MEYKPFRIEGEWYVLAMISRRLVWADYRRARLLRQFELPEGTFRTCCDVSGDGEFLVAGYWYTKGVDFWSLGTGEHLCRFGPGKVSRVAMDHSGRYVALRSDQRNALLDRVQLSERRLPYVNELDGACRRHRDETLLLPTSRRGVVYRLKSQTGRLDNLHLPGHAVIWNMRWSPAEDQLLLLESNGRVSCRADLEAEPQWERVFEEREMTSLGGYSENGRFIGLSVPEISKSIVLEASTGREHARLDILVGVPTPFEGSCVLSSGGHIVNLETGAIEEGFSSWKWWRAIGA
jgi:hypothetical protein